MKLRSVLSVPASALMLFIGACDRQPQTTAKTEPAIQVEEADGIVDEPAPQPTEPDPTAPSQGEQGGTDDWHKVASSTDTALLGRLDEAWDTALTRARRDGYAPELKALGALVVPDAAQSGRLQPAPGKLSLSHYQARGAGRCGFRFCGLSLFCLLSGTDPRW